MFGDIEAVENFMLLHNAVINEDDMHAKLKEVIIRDYKELTINPSNITTIWQDTTKLQDIQFISI